MNNEPVASLDIGTTKTVAVVAMHHANGVEILGIGEAPSTGMRRGAITNFDEVVRSIELATAQAEREAGTTISQVFIGVGGEHIRTHTGRASVAIANDNYEVSERDVKRVLQASRKLDEGEDGRRVLHTLPRAYALDDVKGVVDPVGLEGRRLEVDAQLVSAGGSNIANLIKCVTQAGLEPVGMVYEPLAASAATLDAQAMMAGALLIEMGGGTTHVALISRGRVVHTAVVPVGGSLITSDIAMGLRTSMGEAESIKCNFNWYAEEGEKVSLGANGSRRELDIEHTLVKRIVQPRLQEWVRLIRSELAKSIAYDLSIEEIVLTGGGANLSGIEEEVQEFFGLPTRIGVPTTVEGLTEFTRQPQYAAPIGLVVYGPSVLQARPSRPRKRSLVQRIIAWVGDLWN